MHPHPIRSPVDRPTIRSGRESKLVEYWVFLPKEFRLFQIDPEIQFEGGGIVQPFPCGHDQFLPFDRTAFENRNVGKVNDLELLVQITESFSSRPFRITPKVP